MSDVDNPFPGEDEEGVAATVAEKPKPVKKAAKNAPPPDKDRWAITKHYRRKDGPYSEGKYGIKTVHLWTDDKGAHYRVNIYLTVNAGKPVSTDHLVESDFFVCRDGGGVDKDGKPNRIIHSINGAVISAA